MPFFDLNTRRGRARVFDLSITVTVTIFLVRELIGYGTWDAYAVAVFVVLGLVAAVSVSWYLTRRREGG